MTADRVTFTDTATVSIKACEHKTLFFAKNRVWCSVCNADLPLDHPAVVAMLASCLPPHK